jgi:hypothetical protein
MVMDAEAAPASNASTTAANTPHITLEDRI